MKKTILTALMLIIGLVSCWQEKKSVYYYQQQADSCFSAKDYDKAIEYCNKALKLDSNNNEAKEDLTIAYAMKGEQRQR